MTIHYYNKNYWIPKTKKELLDWFKRNKPDWKITSLKKMPKSQLFAIYFKEREEQNEY
jgi:hypothetical protein